MAASPAKQEAKTRLIDYVLRESREYRRTISLKIITRERSITAIMAAFQAADAGSTPAARIMNIRFLKAGSSKNIVALRTLYFSGQAEDASSTPPSRIKHRKQYCQGRCYNLLEVDI